ncbi:MAG: hypothetical protein AAFP77_29280 [Bacteroidota bacterium]
MPNQRLLEVLQCFTAEEQKRLKLFVASAYHNKKYNRTKVTGLLDHLLSIDLSEDLSFDKQALNHLFFPEKPFRENEKNPIDSLASDLYSLVCRFILLEKESEDWDKGTEALAMAHFFRRNNRESRFWQMIKQARDFLVKQKRKDRSIFFKMWLLEEEIGAFQSIFNTYNDDSNLVNTNNALDRFYTVAKFEKAAALLFQKNLGRIEAKNSLLLSEFLVEIFQDYEEIHTPLSEGNYLLMRILKSPDDDDLLHEFIQKAKKHRAEMPIWRYRNLMAYYRYFIGRKYQLAPSDEKLRQLFELYKEHLEQGFFHLRYKKHLMPGSLKLMTNIAIKVGATDWAKQLLKKYPPAKIAGTRYPAEAHSLCEADVFFAEGDYEKASQCLTYRNFENVNYSILADILLIKIYYTTDHVLLENRIAALSRKVRRSKLTQNAKQQYLNFLRIVNLLLKNRFTKPAAELSKISTQIDELSPMVEREWLRKTLADI